jgi:uncharacterized OB-fold protein
VDDDLQRLSALVDLTPENRFHFLAFLDRRLVFMHCQNCGKWIYPCYPHCPDCWSVSLTPEAVSGSGRIFSAVAYHRFPGVRDLSPGPPYVIVAVELKEQVGLRYIAPLVDSESKNALGLLDMPAHLHWSRRGGLPTPAFRLQP